MKKVFVGVFFLGALFSCNVNKNVEISNISWETYCDKYGVDVDTPTEEEENYYLDCYVGSVEEENDLKMY